jgi:hypothetical protein
MGGNEQLKWLFHDIFLSMLDCKPGPNEVKSRLVGLKSAGLN